MEALNLKLEQKVDTSSLLFTDVLRINVEKSFLYDKLYDIVEASMKVDSLNIQRKAVPPSNITISNDYPLFEHAK